MRLRISILMVIASAVVTFLTRVTGILNPKLLQNPLPFGIISLLSFLAILFFLVIFFIDFAKKEQLLLKIATGLMILGSVAIFILSLKAVMTHFRLFTQLYYYGKPGYFDALVPFLNSAITVFFFSVLFKEIISKFGFQFKLAVLLVIASSFANFTFKSIVLKKYFLTYDFSWLLSMFVQHKWVIVSISVFWFVTNLYFYIAFYRELKK